MVNAYESGEEFLMEIPTPPNLSSEFPENPIVLAKYVGKFGTNRSPSD